MSKTFNIRLSDFEYDQLKDISEKENISISEYIRSKTIPNYHMEKHLYEINLRIRSIAYHQTFTLKGLLGNYWDILPQSEKIILSKKFANDLKSFNKRYHYMIVALKKEKNKDHQYVKISGYELEKYQNK